MARFLALHDYGMGGLWWWITADSPEQVTRTLAEVEVVTDAETVLAAEDWELEEVDLAGPLPVPLDDMRAQRDQQRHQPGFGATAERDGPVWLRLPAGEYDGDGDWLVELDTTGRRLRQIELRPDGDALLTHDWPFNPPFDLYQPRFATMGITQAEFEQTWSRGRPDPDAL